MVGRPDAGRSSARCSQAARSSPRSIVVVGLKAGGFLGTTRPVGRDFGSPEAIGRLFLTDHLLAFEVTSIVLLVAAVGGVVLGSHARTFETPAERRCTGLTSAGT